MATESPRNVKICQKITSSLVCTHKLVLIWACYCLRLLWKSQFEMMRWNGSDCGPSRPCIHFLAWLDMKFIWKHVYFCFHTITILHIFCNDMSFTCETLVNSRWTNLYVRRQPLFILIKGLKCDSSISGFKHHIIIKTKQNPKCRMHFGF